MKVIKGKKIAIIAIFMVFMIGGICFARQMNKENNIAVHTSGELAQIEKLPNNKIGWGIKRNNNSEQPDVGKKNMEILDNVHNGEVMLLHATSKDNSNILDDVIKEIKNRGYEFRNIDNFER